MVSTLCVMLRQDLLICRSIPMMKLQSVTSRTLLYQLTDYLLHIPRTLLSYGSVPLTPTLASLYLNPYPSILLTVPRSPEPPEREEYPKMAMPLYDDCDCRWCDLCPDTARCPLYLSLGGIDDDEYFDRIFGPSV